MPRRVAGQESRSPDWYRGNYLAAVGYATLAQLSERGFGLRAAQHAGLAALELEVELAELDARPRSVDQQTRWEFLSAFEPTLLLLVAGIARRWGWPVIVGEGWEPISHRQVTENETLRSALIAALRGDLPLTPTEVIDFVQRLQLDYRARYNLACYYAGIEDDRPPAERDYRRPFSELSAALKVAPRDLVAWANDDPSLEKLRTDPDYRDRFARLVAGEDDAKPRPARRTDERSARRKARERPPDDTAD